MLARPPRGSPRAAVGRGGALAGAAERLFHDVHPGHVPAALRELDAPDAAPCADVQRRAERRARPVLLAGDELEQLVRERRGGPPNPPPGENARANKPV